MPRDYYEVLGVDRGADDETIKSAFYRLARELHPDANEHDAEAEEKFKEVAEAFDVLGDAERRRQYDAYGLEGLRTGGYAPNFGDFGSISDLFSAFFGSSGFDAAFGGTRARGGAMQGGDVAVLASIELTDAAHGKTVEVAYDARSRCPTCNGNGAKPGTPIETCSRCQGAGQLQAVSRTAFGQIVRNVVCDVCGGDGRLPRDPCETCRGEGMVVEQRRVSVDIPAGIDDGQRIRVAGRGHGGERGGPSGDLFVVVRVAADERFLRDGSDLVTVVDVPAPLAALGTTVQVPTLDGPVPVEIKAGTQPGEEIRLGGRGMPPLQRRGRTGDLRAVVNVTVPRRLTHEQRDMLERFADTLTEDNHRADEGMIAKLRRVLAG
jgi:molecular chaperone DnaJ